MSYKFDRSAFKAQTFAQEQKTKTFAQDSVIERLKVSFYLNSIAYGFDLNHPPKMDKTLFSMRKLCDHG